MAKSFAQKIAAAKKAGELSSPELNGAAKKLQEIKERQQGLSQKEDCPVDVEVPPLTVSKIDGHSDFQIDKQPTYNRPITDLYTTDNRQLTDIQPTNVGHITDFQPTNNRHITDNRPINNRQTTNNRPTNNRQTTDPIWIITDRQAIILWHLINRENSVLNRAEMMALTGMPTETIKASIRALVSEKFITKPERWKNKGSVYSLYPDKCDRFIQDREAEILNKFGNPPTVRNQPTFNRPITDFQTTDKQPTNNRLVQDSLYSSSSYIKETTTTKTDAVETDRLESELRNNPELGYWRQKGLTAKQVRAWCETAACSPDTLIQYLSYCRFDMLENGKEETIENLFNYFFRVIEKSGCYPKPKGYKSLREKQIDAEREIVAQKEKEITELRELAQKKARQEHEREFWKMMADPDCELYSRCFDRLNDFNKSRKRKGGTSFENAMLAAFDEVSEDELAEFDTSEPDV